MGANDAFSKQGTRVQNRARPGSSEDRVITILEQREYLRKYQSRLDKLASGSLDVPAFLRQLAPEMLQGLLVTAETTKSDNLKTAIQQDILDRAGYGKITKAVHVHQPVDHNTTRQELMSLVKSKAREAGIAIKGIKNDDEDIIDVSPDVVQQETTGASDKPDQVRSEDSKPTQDNSSNKTRDV